MLSVTMIPVPAEFEFVEVGSLLLHLKSLIDASWSLRLIRYYLDFGDQMRTCESS